jgi:hypothetical protein
LPVVNSFEQWSSSHWAWVLGGVILCLVVLSGIFVSPSAVQEAEVEAVLEDDDEDEVD